MNFKDDQENVILIEKELLRYLGPDPFLLKQQETAEILFKVRWIPFFPFNQLERINW